MVRTDILSGEDLKTAVASSAAVIHVDVDWSASAIQSRLVIEKFCEAVVRHGQLASVAFYRVDCTEQNRPQSAALDRWLEQATKPRLRFHGNGALIWLQNGKIIDSIDYAAAYSVDDLVDRTRNIVLR
jgi:hypothetical protein